MRESYSTCAMFKFLLWLMYASSTVGQGTPVQLQSIVVGRCFAAYPNEDCQGFYNSFSNIATGRPETAIRPSDFDTIMQKYVSAYSVKNKNMFFSNVANYLPIFSNNGQKFHALSYTPANALDGLSFCPSPTSGQFNTTYCGFYPFTTTANAYGASVSYWASASMALAQSSTGNVTIFLGAYNGRAAYRVTSYFAVFELPNLNSSQIDNVHLVLIPNNAASPAENCVSGSGATLMGILATKFGASKVFCDDKPDIMRYFCVDYPHLLDCQIYNVTAIQLAALNGIQYSEPSPSDPSAGGKYAAVAIACWAFGTAMGLGIGLTMYFRIKKLPARHEKVKSRDIMRSPDPHLSQI